MAEFDRYGGGRLRDRPWHRGRRHHADRPRPRPGAPGFRPFGALRPAWRGLTLLAL